MKLLGKATLVTILKWRKLQTLCLLILVIFGIFMLPPYYTSGLTDLRTIKTNSIRKLTIDIFQM